MEKDNFHGELPEGGYRTVARRTSSRSSRLLFFLYVYMLTIAFNMLTVTARSRS